MIEEVTAYRVGGTIVRKHVVTSPHRRLDVALRHIAQGIYNNTFNSRKNLADAMADEIIAVADNDQKTMAVRERIRLEKEAEGAR
jgi:small subunit ribosomal protein S7